MANRLILVPEDLYKGLISTATTKTGNAPTISAAATVTPAFKRAGNQQDDVQDIGVSFIKKKMDSAKRRIRKPAAKRLAAKRLLNSKISSNKNLYDQELRRYLSLRNQFKNRPIKVEVVGGGPKILMKPVAVGPMKRGGVNFGILTDDGELDDDSTIAADGRNGDSDYSGRTSGHVTSDGEEFQSVAGSPSGPLKTPLKTPAKKKDRSARFRTNLLHDAIEETKREFKHHLLADKERFRISEDEQHILHPKTGRLIRGSNLDDIVDRLINPNMDNMPTPIATNIIGKEAYKDDYLKKLMILRFNRFRNATETPKTFYDFVDNKRNSATPKNQSGRGGSRRRKTSIAKSKGPSRDISQSAPTKKGGPSHYFRPVLWRHGRRK
jgi:hypothetical protein